MDEYSKYKSYKNYKRIRAMKNFQIYSKTCEDFPFSTNISYLQPKHVNML